MLSCIDVANYFLVLVDRQAGDTINLLRLQRLTCFAQGVSLALLDRPLFNEEILAYEHGTMIRELDRVFGSYKDNDIPPPLEMDFDSYIDTEKQLIYNVYTKYDDRSDSMLLSLACQQLSRQHSIRRNTLILPVRPALIRGVEGF